MNRFRLVLYVATVGISLCACKSEQPTPQPTQQPTTALPVGQQPSQIPATTPGAVPAPGQPATATPVATPAAAPAAAPVKQIPGYVYIPPGPVKVGTAPGTIPRCTGNEPAETEVMLGGFYIQQYPAPGPGRPAVSGVTWDQAKAGCEAVNARLCTEIEWERACKGTDNSPYPYNGPWNPAMCAVKDKGKQQQPLGTYTGCVTEEGVHDMIGNVWEWTASTWGIPGTHHSDYVLRGGWKGFGRIANRCSQRYRAPHDKSTDRLGYRCCFGPVNTPIVSVPQKEGPMFNGMELTDSGFENLMRDLEPRINGKKKYKNIRRMTDKGPAVLWRPGKNIEIFAVPLEYDRHHGSRGGTLLVFMVQLEDKSQRLIAAYDRPESADRDNPVFFVRGDTENNELQISVTWEDKPTHRTMQIYAKAVYDCGMIKIVPTRWRSPTEGKVPNTIPLMKILYDLKNQ